MEYTNTGIVYDVKSFFYKIFGWMSVGLALTAATSFYVYQSPVLFTKIYQSGWMLLGLFLAQLALVVIISAFIERLNLFAAIGCFLLYSGLMGIMLASIFQVYQISSIYMVFAITAGMFLAMALFGYLTKADLTTVGSFAYMGLIGLLIGLIINIFLKSSAVDYALTLVGIGVFVVLTAYDVQKLKNLGMMLKRQGSSESKIAIVGALMLYLDFINLFLFLLRFMGKRKD